MLLSPKNNNWELAAITEGKAIIFPYDIVEKYIFNVLGSFRFFSEKNIRVIERAMNGFYILAHGGAKAYLAFLFIEGAEEDRLTFDRYEDFSEVLGISKSMLHRITKSLIGEKLIKKERKSITILNSEGLKNLYKEYLYL